MTSWYSNILTKTSSQISSLRSTLLSSENDGDTEDDTHVCRILRHYYTEKGRPFPPWLPPDPKAPAPAPQPLYATTSAGGRPGYGGVPQGAGGGGPGGQGLSSLWERAGQGAATGQPQSLRAGRPGAGQRTGSFQNAVSQVMSQQGPPGAGGGGGGGPGPGAQSAPAGGSSAQDRLKQRLRSAGTAARGTSPAPGGGGQGSFQPGSGSYDGRAGGRDWQGGQRGYR